MARKENEKNQWITSERVGNVTLFLSGRSSKWQMYFIEELPPEPSGRRRKRTRFRTTGETDISLARIVAHKMNQEMFKRRHFPELEPTGLQNAIKPLIAEFVAYLENLGRTYDHVVKIKSRVGSLVMWMKGKKLRYVEDVTPDLLREFISHLQRTAEIKAATINHYVDAIHNFFGFVIYKKRLMRGPNPAACGRQAHLERLPSQSLPVPTIHPDQVNAIIDKALEKNDPQIVNLIVFVCEGGFRLQELQFLQVGDVDMPSRTITIDAKRPDPSRVRPELRKRCLTSDGLWIPKSRAGRRPVHITNRLAKVINTMGLGEASDWVYLNQAGKQIAQNKTLERLKRFGLAAGVLVDKHPKTGECWSLIRWHWLRHYHRTRAHVSKIRREVSKIAMGHAGDAVHDHYRGLDPFAFHQEYEKFDSGIDGALLGVL